MQSVLTKDQKLKFGPKVYIEDGVKYRITANVRYDDQCGNGHNTFSITGDIDRLNGKRWVWDMGGCMHEEIEKHFPELRHLIKWHLCSSDGPMHYVANTLYHSREISKHWKKWYFYLEGKLIKIVTGDDAKQKLIAKYGDNAVLKPYEDPMAKKPNFDAARRCAIWPEATEEKLQDENALLKRLPALMAEFRVDIEKLGLKY